MGRYLAAILTILSITIGFYIADATAQVQVWNGDLDGSTNANKIVTGLQGKPLPTPAVGALYYDGGSWSFNPSGNFFTPGGDLDGGATAQYVTSAIGNVTLEKYGAKGDGITDDHAAYTSALASGSSIWLGSRTYYMSAYTGGLSTANTSIVGSGAGSVLENLTNQPIVTIGADKTQASNLYLFGTFGAGTSNHGVDIGSHSNVLLSNIWVYEPGGSGVHTSTGSVANMGPLIMGLRSFDAVNGAGFYPQLGEYATLIGGSLYGGTYGVHNDAGNTKIVGVSADVNDTGILVDNNDSNDGHGIVVASSFNHNTTWAADVKPLANGFNFYADHFYYGALRVVGTDGTHLTPSLTTFGQSNIDVTGLTLTNALVQFDGDTWPSANANTITNTGSTIVARPNNLKLDGTPFDFGVDYRWDMASGRALDYNWAGTTRAKFDSVGRVWAGQGTTDAATVSGPVPGFTTSATAVWGLGTSFDGGATPSATNYMIETDGANTYINAPHHLGFGTIQFLAANSALLEKLDPLGNLTTLYQPAEFHNATAPAAPSAGTRVYTDSADGKLKAVDPSENIFVLVP